MQACSFIWPYNSIVSDEASTGFIREWNCIDLSLLEAFSIRGWSPLLILDNVHIAWIIGWISGLVILVLTVLCYILMKRISIRETKLKKYKDRLEFHKRRDQAIEDLLDQQEEEFEQLARKVNDQLGGLMVSALVHLQHLFNPR